MERKTQEQLLAELKAYVRSAGNGEKTTAADIRQFLTVLIEELFIRTDGQTGIGTGDTIIVEADLSSNSTTAVPSVRAVNEAFDSTSAGVVYNTIANAITNNFVRSYYDTGQSAVDNAGPGGTANIYSSKLIASNGILFPGHQMITNIYGLLIELPSNTVTFTRFVNGGVHVLNCFNTTIITSSVFTGSYSSIVRVTGSNMTYLTINNLDYTLLTTDSNGLVLNAPGRYTYYGNITISLAKAVNGSRQRFGLTLESANYAEFYGKGTYICHGTDPSLGVLESSIMRNYAFFINNANKATWEGNIDVYEDGQIWLGLPASTLILTNGVLNAKGRTSTTKPLFRSGVGVLILNNYSILCNAEDAAVHVSTLVLRGNSVVVGAIVADTIIDERPVAVGPGQVANAVGSILEFVFEADTADSFVRTMGTYQAGEYRTNSLQNVATVAYTINNGTSPATLPFTLVMGDTLEVRIARTSMAQAATVILQN